MKENINLTTSVIVKVILLIRLIYTILKEEYSKMNKSIKYMTATEVIENKKNNVEEITKMLEDSKKKFLSHFYAKAREIRKRAKK